MSKKYVISKVKELGGKVVDTEDGFYTIIAPTNTGWTGEARITGLCVEDSTRGWLDAKKRISYGVSSIDPAEYVARLHDIAFATDFISAANTFSNHSRRMVSNIKNDYQLTRS